MQKFLAQDMYEQVGLGESITALNEVLKPIAPTPAGAAETST
jgi:hypothetical protein